MWSWESSVILEGRTRASPYVACEELASEQPWTGEDGRLLTINLGGSTSCYYPGSGHGQKYA
jgi:hypothetical protein